MEKGCRECLCRICTDVCPAPCKAAYPCDSPVTKCADCTAPVAECAEWEREKLISAAAKAVELFDEDELEKGERK